jgi:hypothetical protein
MGYESFFLFFNFLHTLIIQISTGNTGVRDTKGINEIPVQIRDFPNFSCKTMTIYVFFISYGIYEVI